MIWRRTLSSLISRSETDVKGLHSVSAADIKNLPGDPVRLPGRKENYGRGDVVWSPNPAQRISFGHGFGGVLGQPASLNRAGRHDVHRYSAWAEFGGSRLGIAFGGVLAGAVRDIPSVARSPVGADVDDAAPACFPSDVPPANSAMSRAVARQLTAKCSSWEAAESVLTE